MIGAASASACSRLRSRVPQARLIGRERQRGGLSHNQVLAVRVLFGHAVATEVE